jgi:Skp family chaperone for outer membrane proteins
MPVNLAQNFRVRGISRPGKKTSTSSPLQVVVAAGYVVAVSVCLAAFPASAQNPGQVMLAQTDQPYVQVEQTDPRELRKKLQLQRQAERKALQEKKQAERAARQARVKAQREAERAEREAVQQRQKEERQAAEARIQQDCGEYKTWLADRSGIPYAVILNQSPSITDKRNKPVLAVPCEAWVFEDSRARMLFGTTFDSMSADQRKHWEGVAQGCRLEAGDQVREFVAPLGTLAGAFSHPDRYGQIVEGLAKIRKAHARIEQLIEELPKLESGKTDDRKFRELAGEAKGLESFTDDTMGMKLRNALIAGYHQTLDQVHTRDLLHAVREAQGYDMLSALGKIQADMSGDMAEFGLVATWPEEVLGRRKELLQKLAGQEKEKIDDLGHGEEGIKRGAEWNRAFASRVASIRNVVPVQWIGEINGYFEAKRNQTLRESEPEIAAAIARTERQEQLTNLIATYLPLERDRSCEVGKEVMMLALSQQAAIDKARVLGVAVQQAIADTNRTGTGPPAEGDIYDALMVQVTNQNNLISSVTDDCNRAVRNDTGLNLFKAGSCLVFGAGQGKILEGKDITAPQYRVTFFRQKEKCLPAANAQGWICGYVLKLDGNMEMGILSKVMATGEQVRSRFVWDAGHWVHR